MAPVSDSESSLVTTQRLAYTYKRSLGPVLSQFFTALRERRILGVRRPDGSVMVPPREYDPDSGEAISEMVEVSDIGVVKSWAWVHAPRPAQPLPHPFAYALIQLEGADTPLLHVVDAGAEAQMQTGMRVRARWAEPRGGGIGDIAAFVPASETAGASGE